MRNYLKEKAKSPTCLSRAQPKPLEWLSEQPKIFSVRNFTKKPAIRTDVVDCLETKRLRGNQNCDKINHVESTFLPDQRGWWWTFWSCSCPRRSLLFARSWWRRSCARENSSRSCSWRRGCDFAYPRRYALRCRRSCSPAIFEDPRLRRGEKQTSAFVKMVRIRSRSKLRTRCSHLCHAQPAHTKTEVE